MPLIALETITLETIGGLIEIETGYTDLLKEQLDASIEIERVMGLPAPPAGEKVKTED